MKSLKFKTQSKSDYARKSDLTSHQSRTCLLLKLSPSLCLPKLMRHQIITFKGWQIFSFSDFQITKRNLRDIENKKIYKLGRNDVLGLDLLWVHQRIDSLWYIAKAYKTLAGLGGGRRPLNVFTLELSDEMVKHSTELNFHLSNLNQLNPIIYRMGNIGQLSVSIINSTETSCSDLVRTKDCSCTRLLNR